MDALDVKAPHPKREAALTSLRALELTDDDAVRVRALCVKAHEALLESEAQQAKARDALDKPPAEALLKDQNAQVVASLEKSNASLKVAMTTFPLCEREIRALAMRYER